MGRKPSGKRKVSMCVAVAPDVYEDLKKLSEIKTEEHGEDYSISRIGRTVITYWVKKQREKYEELRD